MTVYQNRLIIDENYHEYLDNKIKIGISKYEWCDLKDLYLKG